MSEDRKRLDAKQARLIHAAEAPGILYGSCFDSDSGTYYAAGADGFVYSLNARPAEKFPEKGTAGKKWRHHDSYVAALVWHDGHVISAGYDRRLVWTKADSGEQIREVVAHEGWLRDLVLIPGRGQLASVGDDMLLKVWDVQTGQLVHRCESPAHSALTPEGYSSALYALAASADGAYLATADRAGQVCLWDAATGGQLAQFRAATFYTFDPVKRARAIGGIRSLCFLPGGQLVLGGIGQVSNVDGFVGPCRVEVWNWQGKDPQRIAVGADKHSAIFNHLEFLASDELLVAAGGGDGGPLLAFWNSDLWEKKIEAPLAKAKPKAHIQHFAFDPQTQQLLAAGHNGLQVWSFAAL